VARPERPPGAPLVLGHRGSRSPGPENTPGAVAAALTAGADGVEIDVRRLPDGTLVVAHDPPVGGEPLLGEVLDAAVTRGLVVCEIKNVAGQADFDAPRAATAGLLLDLLTARGGADEVVVSSFDWFTVEAVRAADGPPTGFLTPPGVALEASIGYVRPAGHAQIHAHWTSLTPDGLAAAHRAGLAVVAWTITDVEHALALGALGVDGLICDDPAAVVAAFSR
jgi:glycerophosphoryl diester phosphodiesterase